MTLHSKYWHSPEREVYHWRLDCTESNNIEPENRHSGKDDKRPCLNCAGLDSGDRIRRPN